MALKLNKDKKMKPLHKDIKRAINKFKRKILKLTVISNDLPDYKIDLPAMLKKQAV